MKKAVYVLLSGSLVVFLNFGSTGCQKPAVPAKVAAPTAKNEPAQPFTPPPLHFEKKSIELVLDAKKPVEKIVFAKTGRVEAVEGGKDGVTAKVENGVVPGVGVKFTAAKDAKPGEQIFTVTAQGNQKETLTVIVKEALKQTDATKDDGKKGDAKKDDAKINDAKKDDAKKDDAKKDDAKKDDTKKEKDAK